MIEHRAETLLTSDLAAPHLRPVEAAELREAPLATLDQRLAGAPGSTCSFRTPSG